MPAPYSLDLRNRVIDTYINGGHTHKQICCIFNIGTSTIGRWIKLYREKGDISPTKGNKGRPGKIEEEGLKMIKSLVSEDPSITLSKISEIFLEKYAIVVGASIVSRALLSLGLKRKKFSITAAEKEVFEVKKKN